VLFRRWDKGERDFSLLNEGRINLEEAMATYQVSKIEITPLSFIAYLSRRSFQRVVV
jgi:hypothetical protein